MRISDISIDLELPTYSGHHPSSDHVRHAQGQQQHRDDRSCQFPDDELEVDISNSICVHLKETFRVQRNRSQGLGEAAILAPRNHAFKAHLLDNGFQPPLRAHQRDGSNDFGVEDSKSPVLEVYKNVKIESKEQ